MLDFLYRWLPRADSVKLVDDELGLPFPATEKSKWKKLHLVTTSATPPIPPQSLAKFDNPHRRPHSSPSRAGPSNIAWIKSEPLDESISVDLPSSAPPAVIRVSSQASLQSHVHPITRSVSSPPTSPSYSSAQSSSGTPSSKWSLRLNTNSAFSQSAHSLRLDSRSYSTSTDLFAYANDYPLVKQLSPIIEQDYISPESLRRAKPLPGGCDYDASPSISYSYTNPSPSGSQTSEVTRPSPSYSHPFITRQLNRTVSQTSSRTHISTTSSILHPSTQTSPPPSIPPLNLSPPFPGPHPSQDGTGPPLRHPRSALVAMPTITGSSDSGGYIDDDLESLHAESFVTAGDRSLTSHIEESDFVNRHSQGSARRPRTASLPSVHSGRSRLSVSESFISRRWNRDAALGSGVVVFRAKRQWISSTPAFWAFWLGFICPFLWLIGGWHFTHFGEQPPRLTFWEFYFNAGYWKEMLCGGKRRKPQSTERITVENHPLPKWVAEKQLSDDGRARLNDPKRSLRGISFGYPFISRPVHLPSREKATFTASAVRRIIGIIEKPNRLFDQLYGVKLKEVRGRPESGRRMFDPWIQRCRHEIRRASYQHKQPATAIVVRDEPSMALIFYISTLFLAIATCLAEIVSLRSPPGRSQALVERLNPPSEPRFLPLGSDARSDLPGELELEDIVLVASVDGKFHALNRTSGHTLWSMSSFPSSTSISAPATLGPLVRTNHIDHDPELTDETTSQELYIIEPQSGDIYVMATPTSPLQRFPFTMAELVNMSPFTFSGNGGRRSVVGRKETSLLLIELETGKVKATLNSECPWDVYDDLNDDREVDLDELEGDKPKQSAPREIFIGRTDYHISIQSITTRQSPGSPRPPAQNLSFSVYGPNNQDNHIQAAYKRTYDDIYIQSLPNGQIMSFKARSRGDGVQNSGSQLWAHEFSNPIVAIFDVMRKNLPAQSSRNAFVLLQPRPQLQDVLPNITPDMAPTHLPNLDSAYVGMVKETGSLFAMSPTRFPLVAFGGVERYTQSYLIDGPDSMDADLPIEVDAITKLRKHKEKMGGWDRSQCKDKLYTDRRCLVGIRKLEDGDGHESRMKRLLDGPVDGRFPIMPHGNRDAQPVDTNNETVGFPDAVGGITNATVIPDGGWTKVGGNIWEAAAITLVLGVVSLWFWVKRFRNTRSKETLIPTTEKESIDGHFEVSLNEDVQTPVPSSSLPAEPLTQTSLIHERPPEFQVSSPTPVVAIKDPPPPNGATIDDGEDSERDGEAEGDVPSTPGRRKARRGKRGKKKKIGILLPGVEEENEEKKHANGNANDSGGKDAETSPSSLVINSTKPPPTAPSLIVSDTILGFGSHGTVVFQGSLQGRAVAVKRLLQDFVTLASREVSILQDSDDHPNVIRYYYQEAHANFLYIALELCPASLADIIECPDRDQWRDIAINFDPKKALKQITSGLRHLHALKLVHRDIKPQNILVSGAKPASGGTGKPSYRMLISDFGLCKRLDVDQTSFLPTAQGAMGAGTVGWRAPEILRGDVKLDELGDDHSMSSRGSTGTVVGTPTSATGRSTRLTKSVDIFALGCLFYYALTNGGHPFGDRFEREVNIIKNAKNLEGVERFGEEGSEAADLISAMLDPEAYKRPDTTTCLLHPFFWDPARRLNFLQDASDRFEIMCRDPKDPYLLTLEKDAFSIVGNDWQSRLDKIFIDNLGKFRKYDVRSVQDLLRALRNKKHHYQDLPDNVKRHLGPMPEGFLAYFTRRYPRLFLHVHSVIGSTGLRTESMFKNYFELPE